MAPARELMSNAIRHIRRPAGRETGVRIAQYNGRLRVEVADASHARPVPKTAATDDEHGRGLAIISALSVRWGCCPRRHGIGKAVWVELLLSSSAQSR
ncbi:ATP-binding protein [Streptomyces nogalater]|uniref:ATP-binding protein n=1 Tax=Streptomyces nogalater TaxID=38314 RepID=A0ABW0WHW4_STRNO